MRGREFMTALAVLVGVTAGGFVAAGSASADDFRADTFRLMNAATDQCADLPVKPVTGREVVQEPCTGTPTSVWLAESVPNTLYFRLVNQSTGICVDAVGGGAPVVQADCSPKLLSQQWQFVFGPVGGPVAQSVRVVNRALGQCLEVKDGSLAEGAPLQVSPCADSVAQQKWLKIDVLRP